MDPSQDGPHAVGWRKVSVPDAKTAELAAAFYYPAAAAGERAAPAEGGPWPVVVFSPGGPAPSWQGYEDFGTRFASLGVAALVVAFGDRPADQRAVQFAAAREWLEKKTSEKGWFLEGKLDLKRALAGGHSRGGAAAMIAAADAKKWAGCVAVGPALREVPPKYATPTFVIGSPEDQTLPALYDGQKKPRWLLVVEGMDHFMNPEPKRAVVLKYCAGWVAARALGQAEMKTWLAKEAEKDRKAGVLKEAKVEE
ncbi:MAG: hypothetical protein HYY18_17050 [Planctomycetes bacterium]|nr:hypothetical protein [Planctomycetota bacterium]